MATGPFLAGIFGGAAAGIIIQYFRISAEYKNRRVDELVEDILGAADLATKYWYMDGSDADLRRTEDILKGMQFRLSLLLHDIYPDLGRRAPLVSNALGTFFSQITGGEFETPQREPDPNRSLGGQFAAGELIKLVRNARRQYVPHPRAFYWTIQKLWQQVRVVWNKYFKP